MAVLLAVLRRILRKVTRRTRGLVSRPGVRGHTLSTHLDGDMAGHHGDAAVFVLKLHHIAHVVTLLRHGRGVLRILALLRHGRGLRRKRTHLLGRRALLVLLVLISAILLLLISSRSIMALLRRHAVNRWVSRTLVLHHSYRAFFRVLLCKL